MEEKVSVLMSIYKEPVDWLIESMNSILNQTYRNIEFVIVLDNPPNDNFKEAQKQISNDDRVKVIMNERNLGLVESLNKGLKYCTGDYIARMDADDIAFPNRIEKQMEYMKRHHVDILGSWIDIFDENSSTIMKMPIHSWACRRLLCYYNCLAHPSWMVKKSIYDDLGGYRDIDAAEDYDFLIRALEKRYTIGNVPEVLLKYRKCNSSISHTKQKIQKLNFEKIRQEFFKPVLFIRIRNNPLIKQLYISIIHRIDLI